MSRRIFETVASNMTTSRKAVIEIAAFYKVGDNGDFVVDFRSHTHGVAASDLQEAFASLSNNALTLVPESIYDLDTSGRAFRAAVVANTISRPYEESFLSKMRLVRANVFLDPEDESIWGVTGEGDAKRIVKRTVEDQASILQNAYNANTRIVLSGAITGPRADIGDYVAYYDSKAAGVKHGIVADLGDNKFSVIEKGTRSLVEINAEAVLISSEYPGLKDKAISLIANSADAEEAGRQFAAYLRELYSSGEDEGMIAELERVLNDHRRY